MRRVSILVLVFYQNFLFSYLAPYKFYLSQIIRFMFRSKFCELTYRSVHVRLNVFALFFIFDRPVATRPFFPFWKLRRNGRVLDQLSCYFLRFTFPVNFFALTHCNGCAWFNDFSLLFVQCNFYHFIYFIFTMLRVDVVVALVLLGTVLRTFLTY